MSRTRRYLPIVCIAIALVSCRGDEDLSGVDPDAIDFIQADDPDRFNLFLNADLGSGFSAASETECVGEGCAYYKSIDPEDTRNTLDKWLMANGFSSDVSKPFEKCATTPGCCEVTSDVGTSDVEANSQCSVVMAKASFRDTRDLGYGRDLYLRHDRVGGDIAVFVRNFKFDQALGLPEGLPYGPQNLEALIQDFHPAQFGISAIEFSAFPNTDPGAQKFAKFYTFDGASDFPDGQGPRLLRTDIPERGTQVEMPHACITCHGGRGRSVIDENGDLTTALHGGKAGDVQAHLQIVDATTLQYADTVPYKRSDQEPFIRTMNNAVLHSYVQYRDSSRSKDPLSSYWNPAHAIDFLMSRYDTSGMNCEAASQSNPFDCLRGDYRDGFTEDTTPAGWRGDNVDPVAYENLIVPNCLSCHLLRGSHASDGVSFHSSDLFSRYAHRTADLVFNRGLMPSSFWNYREFWDLKNPLLLAESINLPSAAVGVVENGTTVAVQPPGRPVAVISAPPVAQSGSTFVVSAVGSAFSSGYEWTVVPETAAEIAQPFNRATEVTVSSTLAAQQTFSINLMVAGDGAECPTSGEDAQPDQNDCALTDAAVEVIEIVDETVSFETDFFAEPNGVGQILMNNLNNCVGCHSDNDLAADLYPGIPVVFCSDDMDGRILYKSIRNRANTNSPTDSLLLRKPLNGATSFGVNRSNTEIFGYHGGGVMLSNENDIATIVNWINAGANPDPAVASVPAGFFNCGLN